MLAPKTIADWANEYHDVYISNISDYFGKKAIWFSMSNFEKIKNVEVNFPNGNKENINIDPEIGLVFPWKEKYWEVSEQTVDKNVVWVEEVIYV